MQAGPIILPPVYGSQPRQGAGVASIRTFCRIRHVGVSALTLQGRDPNFFANRNLAEVNIPRFARAPTALQQLRPQPAYDFQFC
jgi:hypothetical protein